jgi:hypothetical protein
LKETKNNKLQKIGLVRIWAAAVAPHNRRGVLPINSAD